mmetsp:Transcript_21494/g.53029  ORF Transcript_21494/g.53029 Transcript_21494/m.53029 type:complete len:339 (-) Transcript_21494:836-1852(-)
MARMGALTLSISCPISLTTASFSPLVCMRSSLRRTSTLLRTSSESDASSMSLTRSARPCADSLSHRSHGAQLPRTDRTNASKEVRGLILSPSCRTHLLGSPPHLTVATYSGLNHSSIARSTLTAITPEVVSWISSKLGSRVIMLLLTNGTPPSSLLIFTLRMEISFCMCLSAGTTPTEVYLLFPGTHAAPLTPGTRSMREGREHTRPKRRRPGLCPCWYMRSQSLALSCRPRSCLWWFSVSRRLESRIESAWARNSQAMRDWYETKRGVAWWHTTSPHSTSLTTTPSTSEAATCIPRMYSRWQSWARRREDMDMSTMSAVWSLSRKKSLAHAADESTM